MDRKTFERYQEGANDFITKYKNSRPERLYELVGTFFHKDARTLDVGCGSGRDLAFLMGAGYQVEGLDAVPAFVEYCKTQFTTVPVFLDSLPKLETIEPESYENLMLCAVLMHLPNEELEEAISNLMRVTKIKGRILISIRRAKETLQETEEREKDGRLYNPISSDRLISLFTQSGGRLVYDETTSPEPGVKWHSFIFEKVDISAGKKTIDSDDIKSILNNMITLERLGVLSNKQRLDLASKLLDQELCDKYLKELKEFYLKSTLTL